MFNCNSLSFSIFCKSCKSNLLSPNLFKRVEGDLIVYSLFKYRNVSEILTTKHTPIGYRVYKFLGRELLRPFIEEFSRNYNRNFSIIGIDEKIKSGYSHIALLTHQLNGIDRVDVIHSKLISKSDVTYASKSLEFRLNNSRKFEYSGDKNIEAVLVDDIITTGTTLKEAYKLLKSCGVDVLFALTIASS